MMWSLTEAVNFMKLLDPYLKKVGYHAAIAGSVITKGESDHDLDLVVYPNDTTMQNRIELRDALNASGLKLKHDLKTVRKSWARKGSHDQKHVEVWEDLDGRRIDVFLLS